MYTTNFTRFCKITKISHIRLSVRPAGSPHGTIRLPMGGFSPKLIFVDFSKICPENSTFIKI